MVDGLHTRLAIAEHDVSVRQEGGVAWVNADEPMAYRFMKRLEQDGLTRMERLVVRRCSGYLLKRRDELFQ